MGNTNVKEGLTLTKELLIELAYRVQSGEMSQAEMLYKVDMLGKK